MQLNSIDVAIVIAYIVLIFGIAISARRFMRKQTISEGDQTNPIANHYLAGKSITFWEALLSIVATEFSALAFLTIPTYVYFENMSYIRFVIGALISRSLISMYFLPKVYGKGLTIFEALARGIHGYTRLTKEAILGRKTFAFFYIAGKLIGVSVKLLGGALLVSEFFHVSLFTSIIFIASMTYIYIMIGGLKAVVRTDMLQASIFILGGILSHFIVGKMSSFTWGELFVFGVEHGKFSMLSDSGILAFFYGIIAGIAYDATTHGVDQDLVQKLFGAKDIETAKKALAWSAVGSLLVNLLFLSLGVVLWAYYTKHGQPLPPAEKIFSNLIENHFPTPIKGLMVAAILAASMSTLDSSINAMSAVFWNDLMNVKKSKFFKLFINLDNLIITLSIVIFSYMFSFVPGASKFGLHLSYLSTGPLLAFFLCRMVLEKYIKIRFTTPLIFLSFFTCFLGMALNHFRFGFNPQLTILWGIVTTIVFMWLYSRVEDLFKPSKESLYDQ
jgi:SSS family solute:Na+ symporter